MLQIFKNSFCYRTPVAAFDLTLLYTLNDRSSRSQMFFKIGALENFAIFAGVQACSFIKKRRRRRCFPRKFENFLENYFYRTPPEAASGTIYCVPIMCYVACACFCYNKFAATKKQVQKRK